MRRTIILVSVVGVTIMASLAVFNLVTADAMGGVSSGRKAGNDNAVASPSAAFTNGNLVVYRVGDGTAALSSAATAVFLDEYTPGGTLVHTVLMPQTANGANDILTASGTSTSEGFLSRSADGQCLVVGGYNKAPGGSAPNSDAPATTNRVIGRVTAAGLLDTTTALNDPTGNIRGAASSNCTDLWMTSSSNGIRYAALGTVGASTQLSTTVTNVRVPGVFGGQLYVSDSSGSAVRLGTVGTGLPTTSGQTITNLPGFPVTGAQYGYFFAKLTGGAGFDTLYVADDTPGTINKYSLVAGNWSANGTISIASARGLTGSVSGSSVTLYVTNGTSLQTLTDASGYNATITGTPTSIATAAANTAIRGVAFAPVAHKVNADFDGDGKTDFTAVRGTGSPFAGSSAGTIPAFKSNRERLRFQAQHPEMFLVPSGQTMYWYTFGSLTGAVSITAWGDAGTDTITPGDFDGDGKDDIAIWRAGAPGAAGFYIFQSSDNAFRYVQYSETGYEANVVADYDGDGKDDPAVYGCNPGGQCFFTYMGSLNNPSGAVTYVPWGVGTNQDNFPDPGDFDGDGKADFCVQRTDPNNPGQAQFALLKSSGGVEFINWGLPTDMVVPGDYDGDGKADFMVARPSGGFLQHFLLTRAGAVRIANWGLADDVPVPGDYDGDGKTDLAVWRPSATPGQSTFYVFRSSNASVQIVPWGQCAVNPCDFPAAGWQVQ